MKCINFYDHSCDLSKLESPEPELEEPDPLKRPERPEPELEEPDPPLISPESPESAELDPEFEPPPKAWVNLLKTPVPLFPLEPLSRSPMPPKIPLPLPDCEPPKRLDAFWRKEDVPDCSWPRTNLMMF